MGSCEHVNEPLGSIKGGEFLDQMRLLTCQEGLCSMELISQLLHRSLGFLVHLLTSNCTHYIVQLHME
jgi:hypothetical protein